MGEVVGAARPIWRLHLGMTSRPRWRNRTVEASAYGCSDFGRASAAADYPPGTKIVLLPISGVLVAAAGAGSRWPGPGVVVAAAQTAAGAPRRGSLPQPNSHGPRNTGSDVFSKADDRSFTPLGR